MNNYPNRRDDFHAKLNKRDTPYVITDEPISIEDGVGESFLKHDNVSVNSIEIWSQPNRAGDRITSFINTRNSGGWARGIVNVKDVDKENHLQIGVHGSGQDINRLYFGKAWNDYVMEIRPATKSTNFVGSLTKENKDIATEEYVNNKVAEPVTWNDLRGGGS